MTTELRGSGPVAKLMGTAAVRAKPAAPHARFNLSARSQSPALSPGGDSRTDEPVAPTASPVVTALPPIVELSTAAWLQRLRIEKRIAPADDEADAGVVAPTPASVYGAATTSLAVSRFSVKG